jgi:hypothetical protein
MKKIIPLLPLLIVTVLSISFVHAGKPIHSEDWVSLEDTGYKMLFPATPKKEEQTVNTAAGKLNVVNHTYEVPDGVKDENLEYALSETEYLDSNLVKAVKSQPDKFFQGSVNGAVKSVNGKLLSQTPIELDGYPGRKCRIDYNSGMAVITMQIYLVNNKVFILQTITETKKDFNKSMEKFMSSFTLKH